MNTIIKAKFIQHLSDQKSHQGFTLIELLVVVIIIGVLAAISIPTLLSQVGKTKESEVKSTLGAMNRAQQVYYLEKGTFTNSTTFLEVPISGEKYYTISMGGTSSAPYHYAQGKDNRKAGTRDYIGSVSFNEVDRTFATVLCKADNTLAPNFTMTTPASFVTKAGLQTTSGDAVECAGASEIVK